MYAFLAAGACVLVYLFADACSCVRRTHNAEAVEEPAGVEVAEPVVEPGVAVAEPAAVVEPSVAVAEPATARVDSRVPTTLPCLPDAPWPLHLSVPSDMHALLAASALVNACDERYPADEVPVLDYRAWGISKRAGRALVHRLRPTPARAHMSARAILLVSEPSLADLSERAPEALAAAHVIVVRAAGTAPSA